MIKFWTMYSSDDGVVIFKSKGAAEVTRQLWLEAGANDVSDVYEHAIPVSVELTDGMIKPQAQL